MKLTKVNRRRLCEALAIAIDSEWGFIEAHRIQYAKNRDAKGWHYQIVPQEYQPLVAQTKRRIKAFERLLQRLRAEDCPEGKKARE